MKNWIKCPSVLFGLAFLLPSPALAQGEIVSWGWTHFGQVSYSPSGPGFTQVAGGDYHGLALASDGSIVAWGGGGDFPDYGQVPNAPTGTGYLQIASGGMHSLALRADGSIESWGRDYENQVSNTPAGTGFLQIAGGTWHSLALDAAGSIHSWGSDSDGLISNTPAGTGFTQVDAGMSHSLALRADGSIASWGSDTFGQITNTPPGTGFIQVVGAGRHSLALRTDGSIVAWGADDYGQVSGVPAGTGFTQVGATWYHSMALRADGTIVSWGAENWWQVTLSPGGGGFTRLAGGGGHAMGLRENTGRGFCAGDGFFMYCPCGNPGAFGTPGEGCRNFGGTGAGLVGFGIAQLSADSFSLQVDGAPGSVPGLILRGEDRINLGYGISSGAGLLCVTGQVARSQVQVTSNGSTTFSGFQGNPFGASSYGAGTPTNYQFWYRDPGFNCQGTNFNFSNAWTVTWLP